MDRLLEKPLSKQRGRRILLAALLSPTLTACGSDQRLMTDLELSNFCIKLQRERFSDFDPSVTTRPVRSAPPSSDDGINTNIIFSNGSGNGWVKYEPDINHEDPSLSPDEKKIVFARQGPFKRSGLGGFMRERVDWSGIYTINTDGSSLSRLTNDSQAQSIDRYPVWSPDNQNIAFVRRQEVGQFNQRLFIVNETGADLKMLFETTDSNQLIDAFKFSPDGERIAINNGQSVLVVDKDGNNLKQLILPKSEVNKDEVFFDWSPNSKEFIVNNRYTSEQGRDYYKIFLVNADRLQYRDISESCPMNEPPPEDI